MSDGAVVPSDYDKGDGFNEDNGLWECPRCGVIYSGNGGYIGPVYDQQGHEYDTYLDTTPGQGPWFCADCWAELEVNQKQAENATLGRWSA